MRKGLPVLALCFGFLAAIAGIGPMARAEDSPISVILRDYQKRELT